MIDRLRPYPATKASGVEWLPELPEGWEIHRAKYSFREADDRSEAGNEELLSVALGNLTVTDQYWLMTALARLIQIDESRRAENAHGSSYCIFEAGRAYFQCLAPAFGTYLRCESVSEKFVPEMGAILTAKKRDRLVREFGFTAPGYSKNFSQKIEIEGKDDLAYVARMAFRVLRDVYDVTDFGATKVKVLIPGPAKPVFMQIHDQR
jgi:hypothetical protein